MRQPVLRILDILVRIRVLGSVPLTNTIRMQIRIRIRIWNTGTYTSFFKEKQVIKMSQTSRNQGFSYPLSLMMEGFRAGPGVGSVLVTNGSGSSKHTDYTDPLQMWIRGSGSTALASTFLSFLTYSPFFLLYLSYCALHPF